MNDEEILITIASIYIAVMVIILSTALIYYYIYEPIKRLKKAKGEKMRKNKKATLYALEGQQQMIDELKDKIEYLELKENGAEIIWGQYTLVRYTYDSEIKEITIGGQMECYKKEKETEQYIILRETSQIITDYSIGKWEQVTTFHIIDKSTGKMYDAQELNEELERYNEMQKMLNEIEEENKEKGE